MRGTIERLTREQAARLPEWRERWLRIGVATGPCDRAACQRAVAEAYAAAGLRPPDMAIWLQSPLAGALGALLGRVKDRVSDEVWANVRAQVGAQVQAQVGDYLKPQLVFQAWGRVRDELMNHVGPQVWDQVRADVWDPVSVQVRDEVCGHVKDQLTDELGLPVHRAGCGQHDAHWLGLSDYFGAVCGLTELVAPLHGLVGLAQSSWWWPSRNAVILTERPIRLARDARGRLHCADRAAIEYPDGWGVYAWHGVRVPAEAILQPDRISVERIDRARNTEIRRVLLERYGEGRYLQDSGAKCIHADRWGQLFLREMPEDEPLCMVRVDNATCEPDGTRKPYWLRVPPGVRTAREAVAWTFQVNAQKYRPKVET